MLHSLLNLLQNYGTVGIFILSMIEAIFFPLPPETLLIPALIVNPSNLVINVVMATLGSTLGAFFGHQIGKKGGRFLLNKYFAEEKIIKVDRLFKKYGVVAILISALTPIPYKVFTIAAGAFKIKLSQLIYASLFGRGFRFLLVGILTVLLGQKVWVYVKSPIVNIVLIVVLIIIITYYFVRKRKFK